VAKGGQVRRALEKRFTKVRQSGSHITFRLDGGTGIYAFHEPRIVGGGQATLEEARQGAAEAIAYALEGQSDEADDEDQVEYLDVAVG